MTLIKFANAMETAVATITWDIFAALKWNVSEPFFLADWNVTVLFLNVR